MLAAQSEDVDLASRVSVSIATEGVGEGILIHVETGSRSLGVIIHWLSRYQHPGSRRHSHINYCAAMLESITHCDVFPLHKHLGGGGAQRYGRDISERGTYAFIGLLLF